MSTGEQGRGDRIKLSYCLVCDSSMSGGENSFLRGLGELQRQQKVDLSLETCDCPDAIPNMLWRIQYNTETEITGGE